MRIREFHFELWLPEPPEKVFLFFGNAAKVERITPSWVRFRILTPLPIEMREGALIDYRIRVRGFGMRWRTRITKWQPPVSFVDEQIRGPYRLWIHTHTFEPRREGTLCHDHVRYAVPFDFLLHRHFVRPDIERIFAFRAEALRKRFGT